MADIRIIAGPHTFTARFDRAAAPRTCAWFESVLPYRQRIIHVRHIPIRRRDGQRPPRSTPWARRKPATRCGNSGGITCSEADGFRGSG